jgi:hypothetical protein
VRGEGTFGPGVRGIGLIANPNFFGNAGVIGDGPIGVLGFAQTEPDPTNYTEDFPQDSGTLTISTAGVYGVCFTAGPALGLAGTAGTSSQFTGVAGSSESGTGVYGQSGRNVPRTGNAGVVGTSRDNTGVVGASNSSTGVFGQSGGTDQVPRTGIAAVVGSADTVTGVVGASNSSTGVFGQSGGTDQVPRTGIAAVVGSADTVTAIAGTSNSAPGVFGSSGSNYGAVFSGGLAPLRLVPASTQGPPGPTSGAHEVGELFVDREGTLFFCKASGTPGTWARIV